MQTLMHTARHTAGALVLAAAILHGPLGGFQAEADSLSGPEAALPKNSVGSAQIKDGRVRPKDLSEDAQPGIVAASEDETDTTFGKDIAVNTRLRKVELDVPGPGAVVVAGSAWLKLDAGGRIFCLVHRKKTFSIIPAPNPDVTMYFTSSDHRTEIFSQTRAFEITKKGTYRFYLLCTDDGTGVPIAVNPSLVAFYVPQVHAIVSNSVSAGTERKTSGSASQR